MEKATNHRVLKADMQNELIKNFTLDSEDTTLADSAVGMNSTKFWRSNNRINLTIFSVSPYLEAFFDRQLTSKGINCAEV